MSAWTAQAWISGPPLIDRTPDMWPSLPGYSEALAAIERGEDPCAQPVREKNPRRYRSAESLRRERDKLIELRDNIKPPSLPDDPGALSGIRRKPRAKDAQLTDSALRRYTEITGRIRDLDSRIVKADAREARNDGG
jgi:hypothetical protein